MWLRERGTVVERGPLEALNHLLAIVVSLAEGRVCGG